jgi:shikimate dehydrogenase
MLYTFSELKESSLATTPHYLVVGNPVSHSLSPVMHQIGLNEYGMKAEYHALKLEHHELGSFISWMNRESFKGCNVTIPFKEQFLAIADTLDSTAFETRALNTIVKKGGKIEGYNTDVTGFLTPLAEYKHMLRNQRAVVFGTGGAAKAVLAALQKMGVGEVVFISRNPESHPVPELNELPLITYAGYSQFEAYAEGCMLIVNTTPLGMYPDVDLSPMNRVPAGFLEGKICYDLIYNPLETKFLRGAALAGAEIINGLEMFIGQGNESFHLWTGHYLPINKVREQLNNQLTTR